MSLVLCCTACGQRPSQVLVSRELKEASIGNTENVHQSAEIYLAGQPSLDDFQEAQELGIKTVLNLRAPHELEWDEAETLQQLKMNYVSVPISGPDDLTDEVFDKVRMMLREKQNHPIVVHCKSANRVGAVWLPFRVLDEGVEMEQALTRGTAKRSFGGTRDIVYRAASQRCVCSVSRPVSSRPKSSSWRNVRHPRPCRPQGLLERHVLVRCRDRWQMGQKNVDRCA
jgi:uncharacterized protein (TIGR01244 family)